VFAKDIPSGTIGSQRPNARERYQRRWRKFRGCGVTVARWDDVDERNTDISPHSGLLLETPEPGERCAAIPAGHEGSGGEKRMMVEDQKAMRLTWTSNGGSVMMR